MSCFDSSKSCWDLTGEVWRVKGQSWLSEGLLPIMATDISPKQSQLAFFFCYLAECAVTRWLSGCQLTDSSGEISTIQLVSVWRYHHQRSPLSLSSKLSAEKRLSSEDYGAQHVQEEEQRHSDGVDPIRREPPFEWVALFLEAYIALKTETSAPRLHLSTVQRFEYTNLSMFSLSVLSSYCPVHFTVPGFHTIRRA